MKNLKRVSLIALLFVMTLPLYAQQEVDPTWYDPWAKPAVPAAHAVPVKAQEPTKAQKADAAAPQAVKAKKAVQEHNSHVTMRAEVVVPK